MSARAVAFVAGKPFADFNDLVNITHVMKGGALDQYGADRRVLPGDRSEHDSCKRRALAGYGLRIG